MPRKILVTGASGFVGGHVVNRLLADSEAVTVLARPGASLPAQWEDRVTVVWCDDWSEQALFRLLDGFSFASVFHLAAYGVRPHDRDVDRMIEINVRVPVALVRLCRHWNARLIHSGTFSEYVRPDANLRLNEQSPLESHKLYGSSKAAGGLLASAVATDLGVGLRALRLFKVYGVGEAPHRLLPALVHGLRRSQRVGISSGTQVLDFVCVDDVVEAMIRSDRHIVEFGGVATWNVATGKAATVRRFAELVADLMKADRALLGFGEVPMRKDDEPWLVGDPQRLESALHWRPQIDLETGVASAIRDILAGG